MIDPVTRPMVVFNDEIAYFVDLMPRRVVEGQAPSAGRCSWPDRARALLSCPYRQRIKCLGFRKKRHLLADAPSCMNGASACQYDVPPDAALAAVRTHGGLVLVDLDETLYLRNSTEDFIDCVWPGLLGLILLRVLDVLKPWCLTGGIDTRDNWRVCAISTFFPELTGAGAQGSSSLVNVMSIKNLGRASRHGHRRR